jgi:aminoglycoside phosphotransferase (APT) family kinase protein
MSDSDEQVFATVASWEKRQGLPVRDWAAMASQRAERDAGIFEICSFEPVDARVVPTWVRVPTSPLEKRD